VDADEGRAAILSIVAVVLAPVSVGEHRKPVLTERPAGASVAVASRPSRGRADRAHTGR
jgi:hypothetical protein